VPEAGRRFWIAIPSALVTSAAVWVESIVWGFEIPIRGLDRDGGVPMH
jgi:hypothetical protein